MSASARADRYPFDWIHRRPRGDANARFGSIKAHTTQSSAALRADHPAVVEGRTIFPKGRFSPSKSPRLLVSGHNNPKLGKIVLKGHWRGMPIFHLTLEERATCPRSCIQWRTCMGNTMPLARRHIYTPDLLPKLHDELRAKAVEHRRGFVVRLHNLGDFPDAAYAQAWLQFLGQIPQLHVFGYTAHSANSEIGQLISLGGALFPDRWAMRFSVSPDNDPMPWQATTIWRKADAPNVPEGLVCPAQTGRTQACATCGLCWSAPDKRIVFLGHGMRRRSA